MKPSLQREQTVPDGLMQRGYTPAARQFMRITTILFVGSAYVGHRYHTNHSHVALMCFSIALVVLCVLNYYQGFIKRETVQLVDLTRTYFGARAVRATLINYLWYGLLLFSVFY